MAVSVIGTKALARLNDLTGNDYVEGWHRGNWGRWFTCVLPPTERDGLRLMNCDWVNKDSGQVLPKARDGRPTGAWPS